MSKHAFLSASGAPAWTRCEAKPWREKDLPDESSEAAEEGTLAHELLEKSLKLGFSPEVVAGPRETSKWSDEMVEFVTQTYDYIQGLPKPDWWNCEVVLALEGTTGENSTCTADYISKTGDLATIVDLKYGIGIKIEAVENDQLLIYAGAAVYSGFSRDGHVQKIKMVIHQPRLNHISEWEITKEELIQRVAVLRIKAQKILNAKGGENLLATPGEKQCMFCKAKSSCPELRGHALSTIGFVDLNKEQQMVDSIARSTNEVANKQDKDLATCYSMVDLIEQWCAAVKKQMYKRLVNGQMSDGRFKLVESRAGNRKFTDEVEVMKLLSKYDLKDVGLDYKMKSPAQMEKSLKYHAATAWGQIKSFIERPTRAPTIVKADDPRPAVNLPLDFQDLTAYTAFKDVSESD